MTFGDSAAYWVPEPLRVCDSCGPGMGTLIVNGSEPAKHRLQPHTRARHSSWRACASDALQAARVASEAGKTCSPYDHVPQVPLYDVHAASQYGCARRGPVAQDPPVSASGKLNDKYFTAAG